MGGINVLNSAGIFYNKEPFDKAGITYPEPDWTREDEGSYVLVGLSEQGSIFVTGYGCRDNHRNDSSWSEENNFVAFIRSDSPCEESFINTMKSGDVYTGDTTAFGGKLRLKTKEGLPVWGEQFIPINRSMNTDEEVTSL